MPEVTQSFDSRIDQVGIDDPTAAVFYRKVIPVPAGDHVTFDARGMTRVSVLTIAGGTTTWSRVDSDSTQTHGTGARVVAHAGGNLLVSLAVDWPFYRVSATSQPLVVAVV